MSTIDPSGGGAIQAQSPRMQMEQRLSAAVDAGALSEIDRKALNTALDALDSSLAGSKPGGTMKDRLDALIGQQVESGALNEDQALELQQFFAEGPSTLQRTASHAPPISETVTRKLEALEGFLDRLRTSQASTSGYGSAGRTTTSSGTVLDSLA